MCNVAFHLGSIYVLFGKQTLYYPPLLVLESLGASAYTFGRHRVNIVSLAYYGGLMRLGGRGLALSCAGRKRVCLSIHGDAGSGWSHSGVVRALGQQQHSVSAMDVAENPTVQGTGKSSSCAVPMVYRVPTLDAALARNSP